MSIDVGKTGTKSILYLDEYKMYSLSSQLFEGLTESITQTKTEQKKESEKQKGPITSGRVLADIATQESQISEKKFLFDYAYTLFERELIDGGLLTVFDSRTASDLSAARKARFIKVTGATLFNDIASVTQFLENFNRYGEAIAYVTNVAAIQREQERANELIASEKHEGRRIKLRDKVKSLINVAELAKASGMHLDEKFVKHAHYLLSTSYGDHFEIQVRPGGVEGPSVFTSILDRKHLRESERVIVKKYTRKAQVEFTVMGMVTQVGQTSAVFDASEEQEDAGQPAVRKTNMRNALLDMASGLEGIESSFLGTQEGEVMVDPIAVYREL